MLVAHLCVKLAGILLKWVIPNYYGLAVSDVFTVVYDTVIGTAFYVGEHCVEPAYLPVFARAKDEGGEKTVWRFTSTLINLQLLLLAGTIAFIYLYPAPIISAITEWDPPSVKLELNDGTKVEGKLIRATEESFSIQAEAGEVAVPVSSIANLDEILKRYTGSVKDHSARKGDSTQQGEASAPLTPIAQFADDLAKKEKRRKMSNEMLPYIVPGLLGMSLASLTYSLLNGYKIFFMAAFGDAVLKLCVTGGAVAGAFIGKGDWRYIALGAIVGGMLKLVTHMLALGISHLRHYRPTLHLSDPHVKAFLLLVAPLMAGILLSRGRDTIMVKVLTAKEGLPTFYGLGRNIIESVGFLVPYTLSIALLPFFCDISDRNDREQLGSVLTKVVRMLMWFFVPVSIVLAAAATPILLFFFSGKEMTLDQIQYPMLVLQIFCIALPFNALEMMVMQAYFSSRRMYAPTIAGVVFSLIMPSLAYWIVIEGQLNDPMHILATVSLCVVAGRVLKSLLLVVLLKTTIPLLPLKQTMGYILQLVASGAVCTAASLAAAYVLHGPLAETIAHIPGDRVRWAIEGGLIGVAGLAAFLGASFLLRMEEPLECWHWTVEKIRRRKAREPGPPPEVPAAG